MDIKELCENYKNMDLMQLIFKELDDKELEQNGYINISGKKMYGVYNLEYKLLANIAWSYETKMWNVCTDCALFTFVELKQIYDFIKVLTKESIKEMS